METNHGNQGVALRKHKLRNLTLKVKDLKRKGQI